MEIKIKEDSFMSVQKPEKRSKLKPAILYMRCYANNEGQSLYESVNISDIFKIIEHELKLDIFNIFCDYVNAKGKLIYPENFVKDGFKNLINSIAGQDCQIRLANLINDDYPKNPISDVVIFDEVLKENPLRWEFLEHFGIKTHILN